MTTIRDRIVALATRSEGVDNKDVQDAMQCSAASAHAHLLALEGKQRVERAPRLPGQRTRWYAPGCVPDVPEVCHVNSGRAGGHVERFTAGPSHIKAQPIEPVAEATQHGVAAGYDPRYQCDPNARISGGFSSLGIGRYLPA